MSTPEMFQALTIGFLAVAGIVALVAAGRQPEDLRRRNARTAGMLLLSAATIWLFVLAFSD